jgi:acetyl-CoA C-acetyltransferase
VIVAAGQSLERDEIVSSIDLMARAADVAFADAPGLATRVQRVSTVDVIGDPRPRPASELAARMGIDSAACEATTVGGNSPQWLVTRTAEDIASGVLDVALLAGAEAGASGKRRGAGTFGGGDRSAAPTPGADGPPDPVVGVDREGWGEAQAAIRLFLPIHVYPLFESAMAAHAGRSFDEHRRFLGELLAPATAVAAKHPYAWFPVERTPDELSTPTDDNRLTAEPYTKRMNAIMAVDQGAAVIMTSLATARELGLVDQVVYVWSGADANEVWYPVQRPQLHRSSGIEAAGSAALAAAGVGIDDIGVLDFYSCFPSAVQAGADALGVAFDDPRRLTITGGLAYFGGPGNNYTMHAIATMVGRVRQDGGYALTNGLGWYITKHSVGVYGAEPPPDGFRRGDTTAAQAAIDASAIAVALEAEGGATVEASTVTYDRDGAVDGVPVFARLDDGRRVAAALHEDDLTPALAGRSLVGARITVAGAPPTYRIEEDNGP